jgi:hypothetical protein
MVTQIFDVHGRVYAFINIASKGVQGFKLTFLRYLAVGVRFSFTAVQQRSAG